MPMGSSAWLSLPNWESAPAEMRAETEKREEVSSRCTWIMSMLALYTVLSMRRRGFTRSPCAL